MQPSDFLKFSLILMLSAFIYRFRNIVNTKKYNFLYVLITIIPITITFIQKDLGAIAVLSVIAMSLYVFNPNTSMKKVLIIITSFLVIVFLYGLFNSYIITRIKDYYSGNSYQTNQALIAVSKGGIFGAGPFQGVQKFNYLPEPQGDSIFGTFAEEFGFIWTSLFLIVYFVFLIRSLYLVRYFKDEFRIMLIVGIVTHFIAQIILNIGSIIKIIPLSGDVLPLFSQGGTSLIVNILEIAIILSLTMNNTRDYREEIIP
ncbi:MAG: FtsW/RodA/SpoVE family cell cycle protein [Candidatus Pacebacteria bacterium]|nr:FtsW/RodA/SpoVE family cell cycle protein [Candidatus Paceibacterota bacterium]